MTVVISFSFFPQSENRVKTVVGRELRSSKCLQKAKSLDSKIFFCTFTYKIQIIQKKKKRKETSLDFSTES